MKLLISIIYFFIILIPVHAERKCYDYELTDGSEPVISYGMDTTKNFWIITAPFQNRYRLRVNDTDTELYSDLTIPVFSPNAEDWASFVLEPSGVWNLITETETIYIPGEDIGEIVFSEGGNNMLYSYFYNDREIIVLNDKETTVIGRAGPIYLDFYGTKFAFRAKRANMELLNINGLETELFEKILPIGFWHDGRFMYAANLGSGWEFYLNEEPLDEMYADVTEVAINPLGTSAAALVRGYDNLSYGILFSKEYFEPIISKGYQGASGLTIHPNSPLISFIGIWNHENFVVFSGTEYGGELQTGPPFYTHDGDALIFLSCNIDCSITINGTRYPLQTRLSPGIQLAHAPDTKTIAFTTNANLVVRDLETNVNHSGIMVDETTHPRFNWRANTYEAMGKVYDRVYLLTCTP